MLYHVCWKDLTTNEEERIVDLASSSVKCAPKSFLAISLNQGNFYAEKQSFETTKVKKKLLETLRNVICLML